MSTLLQFYLRPKLYFWRPVYVGNFSKISSFIAFCPKIDSNFYISRIPLFLSMNYSCAFFRSIPSKWFIMINFWSAIASAGMTPSAIITLRSWSFSLSILYIIRVWSDLDFDVFLVSQNLMNLQIPGYFIESIKKIEFEVSALMIPLKVFNNGVDVIGSAKSFDKSGPQICS